MVEIPYRIQRQINRYEIVDFENLRLYPVRVENYDEFLAARPAIAFVQQSLPVALMSMPLLQAYYQIDVESIHDAQLPTGLFAQALLFLAMSLRIGEDMPREKRVGLFRICRDQKKTDRLKYLEFKDLDGETKRITPSQFQRLRPILAVQNGIELADDDANPELLAADEFLSSKNAPELEITVESLVSSVSALSGVEEAEVYDWPILKLQRRERALKRAMDYIVCGIGESQGAKWKSGNPVPHPWFAKSQNGMGALVSLDDFAGGAAKSQVMQEAKNN